MNPSIWQAAVPRQMHVVTRKGDYMLLEDKSWAAVPNGSYVLLQRTWYHKVLDRAICITQPPAEIKAVLLLNGVSQP